MGLLDKLGRDVAMGSFVQFISEESSGIVNFTGFTKLQVPPATGTTIKRG